MSPEVEARFVEVERSIAETEAHLRVIARQNAALSEMVEVLGGYVNASVDVLQRHLTDANGAVRKPLGIPVHHVSPQAHQSGRGDVE